MLEELPLFGDFSEVLLYTKDWRDDLALAEPPKKKRCIVTTPIEIRVFSRTGRRCGFIYTRSNVQFSKYNCVGKARQVEVALPSSLQVQQVQVSVISTNGGDSAFGLKKIEKSNDNDKLTFETHELNESLEGITGCFGFSFYFQPITKKEGRDLGPEHKLLFSFQIGENTYSASIDNLFLCGHKHESGKKKKRLQANTNNCLQLRTSPLSNSMESLLLDLPLL